MAAPMTPAATTRVIGEGGCAGSMPGAVANTTPSKGKGRREDVGDFGKMRNHVSLNLSGQSVNDRSRRLAFASAHPRIEGCAESGGE